MFGGAGVGKTLLIMKMIHNMVGQYEGVSLFCGIGECCREGDELYGRWSRQRGRRIREILKQPQSDPIPAPVETARQAVQTLEKELPCG